MSVRKIFFVLWILFCSITSAAAQLSIGVALPGVSIGINMPVYPQLVRVPGYPVYYAPHARANYFFYDGMYWVFRGDHWYASSWYNGPWGLVAPEFVPLFVLRIPVRYYPQPPVYFHGWRSDAPPRWGEHWGNEWEQRRPGWDNWNRSSVYTPAPLPAYQRQYSGSRYPRVEQQQQLQTRNYRYQPQEAVAQQHFQAQRPPAAAAPSTQRRQGAAPAKGPPAPDRREASRPPSASPAPPPPAPHAKSQQPQQQMGGADMQKPKVQKAPAPQGGSSAQRQPQPPQQGASQREQQAPKSHDKAQAPRTKELAPQSKQGQGKNQEQGRDKGEQQGGGKSN
jgi:hypothetical protein